MTVVLPPLEIVYYTLWFGNPKFDKDQAKGKSCPIPPGYSFNFTNIPKERSWCTLTSNTNNWEKATALIFHPADISSMPPRIENQPRILETLESPVTAPFRSNQEEMLANYDYLASYHFKSSFLFSYFSPAIMDVVNRPLPRDFMLTKKKESPVLWIARNCMATSGRQKYVRELMKHVTVHSYGSCENNQDFPDDKNRLELMSEYKFYLAIENANCDNYVTEKLFDTFMVSAVPIVDGPVSYDGYLPTNRSVIYMDAYPDPRDLADYIRYLDNNDTAYLEYLSFRRDAVTIAAKDRLEPTFIAQWGDTYEHTQRSDYCSICRGVLPWWQARHSPDTAPYQDTHVTFLVDDSCQPEGKWNYLSTQPYQPQWIPRPRDEFTRPQIEPPLPDTEPLPSIEIADRANHNMARVSNISFACLLFLFIIFLLKRSRSTLE